MTSNEVLESTWQRRRVLAAAGAVGAAGLLLPAATATAAPVASSTPLPTQRAWTRATSVNGWAVADAQACPVHKVEGSDASVALLGGDVATVLLHVARRYHYEVELLAAGSVVGHRTDRRVNADYESSFLSGTAIAMWPNRYPVGARGGLFPQQIVVIRDILAECEGVVRWGGDHRAKPCEGHFQIDVRPGDGRLLRVGRRIRGWNAAPGEGAGTPADTFSSARRRAAVEMEKRQRTDG